MRTPAPNPPILLAAGGTGGHVFPAEALAAELEARGRRLVLMTDRRGAAFGDVLGRIERHAIAARSPSVRGPVARGLAILGLARAVIQAARVLRRIRPAAAVGFGGYPSVPPLVASGRLGIPSVLHEQNAVLGRANRMLARRASAIATSFPETERFPATVRASSPMWGTRCAPPSRRCAAPSTSHLQRMDRSGSWSLAAARARGFSPKSCRQQWQRCRRLCGSGSR